MKHLLFLLLLILPTVGIAQKQVQFEGRILSETDSIPIFNAHIYIENTSIGTSSNEAGHFRLNYPAVYDNPYIIVSCIGYEPVVVAASGSSKIVLLEESFYALDEVIVKAVNPEVIWEKAMANYQENYYRSDIEKLLYYKEYVQSNDQPLRQLEVIAHVGSKGFGGAHKKADIFITQKRPGFNKDSTYEGGNGIEVLYSLKWTDKYLSNNTLKNYEIAFEGSASFLGYEVYHLSLKNLKRPEVSISVYVNKSDYAIVAMKEVFLNRKQQVGEQGKQPFRFLEAVQYVDFLQSASGKWHVNSIDDYRASTDNIDTTQIRRYIKVLSVDERKLASAIHPVKKEADLYFYQAPYDKKFWDNLNVPQRRKEGREIEAGDF